MRIIESIPIRYMYGGNCPLWHPVKLVVRGLKPMLDIVMGWLLVQLESFVLPLVHVLGEHDLLKIHGSPRCIFAGGT